MANRCTLHKSKLNAFKSFLDQKGVAYRPGKGTWQELQVNIPGKGWYCIYSRMDMPEHYTIQDPLSPLVKQFLHDKPKDVMPAFKPYQFIRDHLEYRPFDEKGNRDGNANYIHRTWIFSLLHELGIDSDPTENG